MSPENRPPRASFSTPWLLAGLLIVAVLALGNYKLLTGMALPHWDAADFFGPEFGLVADHIKAHQLLKWNPWTSAGTPDLAEPELGVSSPLLLAVAFLAPGAKSGFIAYWMLIWIGGALGMLFLAKHLGGPLWGCVVAALGFATSGFYTGHAEHISSLYSVSMLPFVIWRLDAALLERRIWFGVQAGALYGLSALGGYPQFTILSALFIPLWALGRIVESQRAARSEKLTYARIRMLIIPILVLALGALICSPLYLGFSRYTRGYSDRTGPRAREEALTSGIFPGVAFSTLSSPYLPLLNLDPNPIWTETDVSMSSIYMGSTLMVLSVFALTRRTGWLWWLGLISLFFACCAVGHQLPVRGWLYDFLIPTRYFRNASLFTAYVIFLSAVLASYASQYLETSKTKSDRIVLLAITIILASCAIAAFKAVVHVAHKRLPDFRFANDHMLFVWIGLAVLAFLFQQGFIAMRSVSRLVLLLATVDAFSSLRISEPVLYTPLAYFHAIDGWWDAIDRSGQSLRLPSLQRQLQPPESMGASTNNRNIGLRVATMQSYSPLSNRFYGAIATDRQMNQVALGPNRVCFAASPPWLRPTDGEFGRWAARWHQAATPILVLHTSEAMEMAGKSSEQSVESQKEIREDAICSPTAVTNLSYYPNSLSFSYLGSRPGWLLVTDRWAPGWMVNVNGAPQQNVAGDFVFRAVRVRAGLNHIEFTYHPPAFKPLLAISWSLLGIISFIEIFKIVRHIKPDLRSNAS
jgi:hypothetical protein